MPDACNPTQISCAYTCVGAADVDRVTEIPDLYKYFKARESEGRFKIKPYSAICERELSFIWEDLRKTVAEYALRDNPNSEMSIFIQNNFPQIWSEE